MLQFILVNIVSYESSLVLKLLSWCLGIYRPTCSNTREGKDMKINPLLCAVHTQRIRLQKKAGGVWVLNLSSPIEQAYLLPSPCALALRFSGLPLILLLKENTFICPKCMGWIFALDSHYFFLYFSTGIAFCHAELSTLSSICLEMPKKYLFTFHITQSEIWTFQKRPKVLHW